MITEQDKNALRNAEQSARDRMDNRITDECLESQGFHTSDCGYPAKTFGLIGVTVEGEQVWLGSRNVWPKPVRTRTQLLAIIAALEAE